MFCFAHPEFGLLASVKATRLLGIPLVPRAGPQNSGFHHGAGVLPGGKEVRRKNLSSLICHLSVRK